MGICPLGVGLQFSGMDGIRNSVWCWVSVLESPLLPCTHAILTAVLSEMKPPRIRARGRQAAKRKEGERASFCLFCVSFQTHPSDASPHLSGGGGNGRTKRGWQCYLRNTSFLRREGWELLCLTCFSFLKRCLPHVLSPIFWLAPVAYFPPGGQSGSSAFPTIPKWLSSHTWLGLRWTCNL